jgi:hypothetical protein
VSEVSIRVRLEKDRNAFNNRKIVVAPIEIGNRMIWIDPAGYIVARSPKPDDWAGAPEKFIFNLDVPNTVVLGAPYLPYAG